MSTMAARIIELDSEIEQLESELLAASHPAKQRRLSLMIQSRRAEMFHMQQAKGDELPCVTGGR